MCANPQHPFHSDPFLQFQRWYQDAVKTGMKYPHAMTLATASSRSVPSARIVLFKGLSQSGFKFFTNYQSKKGKELLSNPRAALLFYWPELDRQIRIEGKVEKLGPEESDHYWSTRPLESRINAAASPQSKPILNRKILTEKVKKLTHLYPKEIPRPKHWGGYCLIPQYFEFWIEGAFRLHDRCAYSKKKALWTQARLAP